MASLNKRQLAPLDIRQTAGDTAPARGPETFPKQRKPRRSRGGQIMREDAHR